MMISVLLVFARFICWCLFSAWFFTCPPPSEKQRGKSQQLSWWGTPFQCNAECL